VIQQQYDAPLHLLNNPRRGIETGLGKILKKTFEQ
jgi:hypothetical protein